MIKNYNNEDLEKKQVNSTYFLFCQAWKELTEDKTLDSYQFKSFNVINALDELLHNINNYLCNIVSNTYLIDSTVAELISCIKRDYVINRNFLDLRNRLLDVLCKKHDTYSNVKSLKYHVLYYKNELIPVYDTQIIQSIKECIDNNDSKNEILLISTFISRCVDNGWNPKALFNKLDLREGKNLVTFLNNILHCHSQEYVLLFPYRLKIQPPKGKTREQSKEYLNSQLKDFGISIYFKEEIIDIYPDIAKEKLSSPEYLSISCKGKDVMSASHVALTILSKYLSLFGFFSLIESWSLANSSWIIYNRECPYTVELKPSDIYGTYEYLDSSSSVYSRTKQLLLSDNVNNTFKQKLFASFNYANLSTASLSLEEKYMNMWIALESLSRTDAHDNIINNILFSVPSACCLRYMYRLIRNFAEDCVRCGVSLDFNEINISIQNSNKEEIVSQLLKVLRDANKLQELESRCSCNELLKLRCLEIADLANDESKFIDKITAHYQTVCWHINRLYRIRNEIAHSALNPNISIIRYTEHLYDYLATYISEIVRFAIDKKVETFESTTVAIMDNYKEFCFLATNKSIKSKSIALKKLWTAGTIDYV